MKRKWLTESWKSHSNMAEASVENETKASFQETLLTSRFLPGHHSRPTRIVWPPLVSASRPIPGASWAGRPAPNWQRYSRSVTYRQIIRQDDTNHSHYWSASEYSFLSSHDITIMQAVIHVLYIHTIDPTKHMMATQRTTKDYANTNKSQTRSSQHSYTVDGNMTCHKKTSVDDERVSERHLYRIFEDWKTMIRRVTHRVCVVDFLHVPCAIARGGDDGNGAVRAATNQHQAELVRRPIHGIHW